METFVELIAKKRDGNPLTEEQIHRLIAALGRGELADYQMSALLMAIFFRGMNDEETVALTRAMLHSGDVLDLTSIPGRKVDKHSTGGVGDKISICLAPLVAACGVKVPMVSGRGLGHTGGTLDKLESIPGFNVRLDATTFASIVRDVGTCLIGQTDKIAPADRRIYALRDVTATVESIPLIVASILSKKLAEGIDALVLDVKVGRGAFMKDLAQARTLAKALVSVGTSAGKQVSALLTDMDRPLGLTIGNALETREAIEVLHGGGPKDTIECTLALGAEMLRLGHVAKSDEEARSQLLRAIWNGSAVEVMAKLIRAQGGDDTIATHPEKLPRAEVLYDVASDADGFIEDINPLALGLSAVAMGAGRTRADQSVDPVVGIELVSPLGTGVTKGTPLARLHVRDREAALSVEQRVRGAFRIGTSAPTERALILETIR